MRAKTATKSELLWLKHSIHYGEGIKVAKLQILKMFFARNRISIP